MPGRTTGAVQWRPGEAALAAADHVQAKEQVKLFVRCKIRLTKKLSRLSGPSGPSGILPDALAQHTVQY